MIIWNYLKISLFRALSEINVLKYLSKLHKKTILEITIENKRNLRRYAFFTRPLVLLNNSIMYGFSTTELILSLNGQAFAAKHGCFFWSVWENVSLQLWNFLISFIILIM